MLVALLVILLSCWGVWVDSPVILWFALCLWFTATGYYLGIAVANSRHLEHRGVSGKC